nr:hypothetical protein [Devosia sp.]
MRTVSAAVCGPRSEHHLLEVGAGDADVTQHAVVELQEVGIGTALFRTAEKRREQVHFASSWLEGRIATPAIDGAAYAHRPMNAA